MCNHYDNEMPQDAARRIFNKVTDRAGNLRPGEVYPDQPGAIIRHTDDDGFELVLSRWGLPSPKFALKTARDPGVTNVRNLSSPHWRRWLGREHRCLVPFTAFAEPAGKGRGEQWFAPADPSQLMFFAGIELRDWSSVRKVKDGETTDDLYAFLTCPPNAEVAAIHPKAMPVILTNEDEWTAWMAGVPASELQRPLPDGSLSPVARPRRA